MGIGLVIDWRVFGFGIELDIPKQRGMILKIKIAFFAIYIVVGV